MKTFFFETQYARKAYVACKTQEKCVDTERHGIYVELEGKEVKLRLKSKNSSLVGHRLRR